MLLFLHGVLWTRVRTPPGLPLYPSQCDVQTLVSAMVGVKSYPLSSITIKSPISGTSCEPFPQGKGSYYCKKCGKVMARPGDKIMESLRKD